MKLKKGSTIIDIIIAILFVSTVLYFCYTLATSAINKRQLVARERDAMLVAENIMNRVISQGVYTIDSEPFMDDTTKARIHEILTLPEEGANAVNKSAKNKMLSELGYRLPVTEFIAPGSNYSYQIIVDDFITKSDTVAGGIIKNNGLKRITVNVYYPVKIAKYNNKADDVTDEEVRDGSAASKDKISLEEECSIVSLTTYKSARDYKGNGV